MSHVVVVCGAEHDPNGLVPTVSAQTWATDPERVQVACDDLRVRAALALPSPVHEAVARLQQVLGPARCTVATTAVDGLLHKAGAEAILELRGSLFRSMCATGEQDHPRVPVAGMRRTVFRCTECGASLRPDVALPGERHRWWEVLIERVRAAERILWVEIDDVVAQALARARPPGARTVAVGAGASLADQTLPETPEIAVPRLVAEWLGD
jgi:NAD-dependent SIR2 family protein deacetylase